jgi:glutamate dehydrogenase
MAAVDLPRGETFLDRLRTLVRTYLEGEEARRLEAFADTFHAATLEEEFEGRNPEDVYGALMSVWRLCEPAPREAPEVRVFNPSLDTDGWVSTHTIAQIRHRDAPFIVDSFLMALARRDLTLHAMHNVVLNARRRDDGHLLDLDGDAASAEVVIHAEIDRLDPDEFGAFETDLVETLGDVRAVVGDFNSMRTRVEALVEALDGTAACIDAEERDESRAFLEWLLDDNFTFLGYREFSIDDEDGDRVVRQVAGSELGVLARRGRPASERRLGAMAETTRAFLLEPRLLQFSKGGTRSKVHRPAWPDYIAVKRFDAEGRVIGEAGITGLYTSNVYMESPWEIPLLRRRVQAVVAASGFAPNGFDGKVLRQVLATYPRDELFQSSDGELFDTTLRITRNHERNRLQVFVREGRYGMFFSCLVYTPREIYTTALRAGVQRILTEELGASDAEFTSYFSESVLIRTHFVLRVDPGQARSWDPARIDARVRALARNWDDDLRDALVAEYGESRARGLFHHYRHAFGPGYRERFDARMAVYDVGHLERLVGSHDGSGREDLVMRLYRHPEDAATRLRLKVYHAGEVLPLSDLLPLLENLGVRMQGQRPFTVRPHDASGAVRSIYDFTLEHARALDLGAVGGTFEDAFMRVWRGDANNDDFNRLVLAAGLGWRDVALLRAYARYMKQIRFPLGERFIADTLVRHAELTRGLVRYFRQRHDPALAGEEGEAVRAELLERLEAIPSLNEDRILRYYLDLVDVTLRTNFFQRDADGAPKRHLSFKLASGRLPGVPKPALPYEIFVCAPDMEGVHLRSGPIARGGLRWSDRVEDYRTEVLGLVKAQQVKNAVIVPQGAKGGFVITAGTDGLGRDERHALGVACYSTFIRGLLDLTDNRVAGEVVPPADVRRHDGDDPYLVVAADKGTATFSDIANGIAAEYGFWFGDAFASGGSRGYDHKKMGITARGAWVSVQRHFRESGVDVQRDRITVLGIGDMSGDVFGNGMLQSESIAVVAAFNHLHVFVDPDPDLAASHAERQRLFALPRSGWGDYDRSLISAGGGVFSRQAKSIEVSAQMRETFGLAAERMTPDELVHALLKAPVDLIWNGGIGTYVKAGTETHADAGDKANDAVRVDGSELRCRVFGEGGNLGLTQRGRVEAALAGVALNTDFIDNSGGVDCSDHEVNIKLLLGEVMAAGDLTTKQRNALLEAMTDDVATLVLANNYRQAQALALIERHARGRVGEYQRFVARMEAEQGLDRSLEELPEADALAERVRGGGHLTRPELAVLLAYAKAYVKERLVGTEIVADPHAQAFGLTEFPELFNARFADRFGEHYVHEHIVATQLANDVVHHMGVTFVVHVQEYTGASVEEVVRAWLVVREVFAIDGRFRLIEGLDAVPAETRDALMLSIMRLGRRASRWFLRHRRDKLDPRTLVDAFAEPVAKLTRTWVRAAGRTRVAGQSDHHDALLAEGVPADLAALGTGADNQVASLAIIDAAQHVDCAPERVGPIYLELATRLRLDVLSAAIGRLEPHSLWQAMERDALLDDLITHTGVLCRSVLQAADGGLQDWLDGHGDFVADWERIGAEVLREEGGDFSMYAMAVRKLGDLLRTL